MSDYFIALEIFLTNFRGREYLFPRKKILYYDDEIEEGLSKINKIYLPLWVLLGGMGLAVFVGKQISDSLDLLANIILAWLIIDLLIVTPLIYMAFLPKPIKNHVKRRAEMTAEELDDQEKKKTAFTQSSDPEEDYKYKYLP